MAQPTDFQQEVANLIVETLHIQDKKASDIKPEEPLFYEGLGLDSIDALELALAISRKYGFQLRSDDEKNVQFFASLAALAAYIQTNRTK